MIQNLQALRNLIEKGFYLHNLSDLISFCDKEIDSAKHKLVLFTFKGIFKELEGYYEPVPISVTQSECLTEGIQEKLYEIIDNVNNLPAEKLFELLTSLIDKLCTNQSKIS